MDIYKPIKITKNLKFGYEDLMRKVDFEHEFTLRDVLRAVTKSKIPYVALAQILQCPYLCDYYREAKSKKFVDRGDIEYLEVDWIGDQRTYKRKLEMYNRWDFRGVGKKGQIGDDLKEWHKTNNKKLPKDYRESYGMGMTPMYKLANYFIKLGQKIHILNYDSKTAKDAGIIYNFQPSITLVELLYSIFFELSFYGSPARRDAKKKELDGRIEGIRKAEEEGRLDEVLMPWEEVKKRIKKKIKDKKK